MSLYQEQVDTLDVYACFNHLKESRKDLCSDWKNEPINVTARAEACLYNLYFGL